MTSRRSTGRRGHRWTQSSTASTTSATSASTRSCSCRGPRGAATTPDWGYAPYQYFSVEARYAHDLLAPAEKLSWLKRLISECHDRDIHVIMDGVFNHVSVDFPYKALYRDPAACPYTSEIFGGHFDGLQDLDFAPAVHQELIRDVCRYWIETFGVDGIRFDNTVNYYVAGDIHGLPELLADIRRVVDPEFSMTLEHIDLTAVEVTEATGATSFWDNSLYGLTLRRALGRADGPAAARTRSTTGAGCGRPTSCRRCT